MPKGVGATFCSKTGPFFSCGCSKAPRVPVCPRRPKPHSAKQGRSFRVAPLNRVLSLRIEKWILECSCVPKGVAGPHSAAKQGSSFRVAALNHPVSHCAQGGPSHILQQNGCSKLCFALHKPGKIWLILQPNFVHKMCILARASLFFCVCLL